MVGKMLDSKARIAEAVVNVRVIFCNIVMVAFLIGRIKI